MRFGIAIALALWLLLASAACAQEIEGVDLVWKFVPGQTLVYEVTMSGSGTQSTGGKSIPVEISAKLDLAQRVLEVHPDESADMEMSSDVLNVELTIERAGEAQDVKIRVTKEEVTVETPMGTQRLRPEEAGMRAMPPVIVPLKMTMNERGEVLACSTAGMGALSQLLDGMDCSRIMRPAETAFPSRPVAPGESWDYVQKVSLPGAESEVDSAVRATLKRVEEVDGRRTAVISQRGAVDVSDIAAEVAGAQGGPSASVTFEKMTQATQGAIEFALDEGRLTKATYETDMSMAMRLPVPEMAGIFRKIASQMKMRVEMKLKDVRG